MTSDAEALLRRQTSATDAPANRDRLVVAGLLALTVIPIAAGGFRLWLLAAGGAVTADNLRFVAAPVPVILHIASATIYSLLGAFQFHAGLRRRHPGWHRRAGRLLVVAGLVAAGSGLWMAETYTIVPPDHPLLHAFRLLAGTAMGGCLVVGFMAIRGGDVARHRDFMRRGYAIAMGAGTQALVILPPTLVLGPQGPLAYALEMGLGWAINIVVAEALIRRRRRHRRTAPA